MGDFDACRFDFRLDAKNGLMPSKRRKTERIQPSNYSTLFKCKICGTLFTCRTLLLEHKMTHSEYRYNKCKYECGLCTDKKFSRKDHLRDHLAREHQLDDAKVAEIMGDGRLKNSIGRKSRGSLNRKSEGSFRKPAIKRVPTNSTALEDDLKDRSQLATDDVNTTVECNSTINSLQSNPVVLDSPQAQITFGETFLPPNYLCINFPILITPPAASNSIDSAARIHSTIQNEMNWSTASPQPFNSDLSHQRIKVEVDEHMTSQPRVTTTQTGSILDLPTALSRFLAYNNYVTLQRNDVDERNCVSYETSSTMPPFNFLSSAIKRDLELLANQGRSVQTTTLNDLVECGRFREEEDVLDFSLKTRSHITCNDQCMKMENSKSQSDVECLSEELDDAVDLSRKDRSSDGWSGSAAVQSRNLLHTSKGINEETNKDKNRTRKLFDFWNPDTSKSSNKLISPPDKRAKQTNSSEATETMRSSMLTQTPMSKGRSVLNKTVEKLWKSKIGHISEIADERTLELECATVNFNALDNARAEASTSMGNRARDDLKVRQQGQGARLWPAESWKFSEELPANAQSAERIRSLEIDSDLLTVDAVSDDKETRRHTLRKGCTSKNGSGKSSEEEEEEMEKEENKVIDLTKYPGGSKHVPVELGSQLDGLVLPPIRPSSADRPSSDKPQSPPCMICHAHQTSDLDSPTGRPLSQSEHSFYKKNNELEIDQDLSSLLRLPTTLTRPCAGSHCENSSVLWPLTSSLCITGCKAETETSDDLIKIEDISISEDCRVETNHPLSSDSNNDAALRSRKPDNRLNCGYPHCGKTFKEWRHLKVHLTLHTGEKPLSCHLCKYTCRHRSSMNWHMKSKHRMEKSKIHGNRTVYVDVGRATVLIGEGNREVGTKPLRNSGSLETNQEEEKGAIFLNEFRNSLNLLTNGLKQDILQQHVTQVGTDIKVTNNSPGATEEERLNHDLNDTSGDSSKISGKVENRYARPDKAVVSDETLPQLLLKKVVPAPGKDPKFYTSLMRIKYARHPTKLRTQRQPFKRRPNAVKREAIAGRRCVTCGQVFDCVEAMWTHRINEHNETLSLCHCERCGFVAENQEELQSHLLGTHGTEMEELKDYLCSICGKGYSSKTGLNHHLQRHRANASVQFICPLVGCSEKLAGKGALRYHLRLVHPGAKMDAAGDEGSGVSLPETEPRSSTPSPPLVGASTPLAAQMDGRPVVCDYPGCDKLFRELKHLKVHQMQHTDEKPLRCLICDYSCRQRNSMNWHMKSKHGQRKHVTNDGRTIYI